MKHDTWDRVAELFDAVVDLPPPEREERLAAARDETVAREVRALLAAAQSPGEGGFITDAIAGTAAELTVGPSREGQRVGPYRLTRELGHGGMGAVYLAEREDAAYHATVAIKFIRGAFASPDAVRRFRSERQILADLEHPNIARLLDGGTTDDGTPYLVMEHVDGEPIDAYCAHRGLGVRARIRLFRTVCEAVQAAHGTLVVHRDLKPENILVTSDGRVKLVDFGIAKLLDDGDDAEEATTIARLTPSYASPEQVRGERVTVATDVYSLGVILYELLTGRLPVDPAAAPSRAELERRISEDAPPAPSTVVDRPERRRELAGDVDTIVGKALRKEPAERYQSAADLAEDLRRFLGAELVSARPPTIGYRMRKFVRRHRSGVFGTAAGVAVMVGLTAFYVARLADERDFAQAERRKATQVAGFLERLFRISDPSEARGATVTAREVLDTAVAHLPDELAGQPETQTAMYYTLGGVYANLGLERDAEPLLEQGLALRLATADAGSPSVGDFFYRLGTVVLGLGRFDSAASLFTQAAGRLDAERPGTDAAVLARVGLANAHRRAGRLEAADSALALALAAARTMPADSALDLALTTRAALYLAQRRAEEAEPLAREAWQRMRDRFGEDAPRTLSALNNLGQALYQQTRYDDAEPVLRKVLALRERVLGADHPNTGTAWNNLAALLQADGRHAEAVEAGRRALEIWRANYGEQHQRVTLAMTNLASMLLAAGRVDEAERMHRDALRIKTEMLAPGHIDIAVSWNNLASVLERTDRYAEAEAAYRRALEVIEAGRGIENGIGSIFLANLGRVVEQEGRVPEAEATLRRALAIQREVFPAEHARTATTLTLLGALLVHDDRPAEAEPLLREALRMRTALLDPDHWEIQVTRSTLGVCLATLGAYAEAEELLTTSAEALHDRFGPDDDRARTAVERAVDYYERRGEAERASQFRELLKPATASPRISSSRDSAIAIRTRRP